VRPVDTLFLKDGLIQLEVVKAEGSIPCTRPSTPKTGRPLHERGCAIMGWRETSSS
jgi:hypothetical protein